MFNLEQSIAEWRRQMLAADIKSPVPLDELETHLRDEIEQQAKSGLSEADAFKTAVQRIGQAHMVQNEFRKVEAKWEGLAWRLKEILLAVFSILMPLAMGRVVLFKMAAYSEMTFGQQISGLAAIATFSLLIWGGRLGYGMFPAIPARRTRNAIVYSCVVPVALWWSVFLCIIMLRYDFTMAQFGVAFLWGFIVPGGVLIGLPWGIETAARKKIAMPAS
jgi:hypothetical protein